MAPEVGLVDFAISFVVLLTLVFEYKLSPDIHVLGLPFLVLLSLATALGVGLWLSALNALYRDVGYVLPFVVQFWMLASPVAYPSSLVPAKWRWLVRVESDGWSDRGFPVGADRPRAAAERADAGFASEDLCLPCTNFARKFRKGGVPQSVIRGQQTAKTQMRKCSGKFPHHMVMTFEATLISVWRQSFVENSRVVVLGGESFPVLKTFKMRLKQITFQFRGRTIRGIEQNPVTKSRWAALARLGQKVMQFVESENLRCGRCGRKDTQLAQTLKCDQSYGCA